MMTKKRTLFLALSLLAIIAIQVGSGNEVLALENENEAFSTIGISELEEEEPNSCVIENPVYVVRTDKLTTVTITARVTEPYRPIFPPRRYEFVTDIQIYLTVNGVEKRMSETVVSGNDIVRIEQGTLSSLGGIDPLATLRIVAKWNVRGVPQTDKISSFACPIGDDDDSINTFDVFFSNINGQPLRDDIDDSLQFFGWEVSDVNGLYNVDVLLYWNGIPTYISSASISTWEIPQTPGAYYLEVTATDNDYDGWEGDRHTSTRTTDTYIVDDDDSSVDIADIACAANAEIVTITFTDVDYSGIASVDGVAVDDVAIPSFTASNIGSEWTITFPNDWVFQIMTHDVDFVLTDADNEVWDWPIGNTLSDALSAGFSTSFTSTEAIVVEWIDLRLDELKEMVLSTTSWRNKNNPMAMASKIDEVVMLKEAGFYAEAYDKLLHDIKPKLTALKVDENGIAWGNGSFKEAWITDSALFASFEEIVNKALFGLNFLF